MWWCCVVSEVVDGRRDARECGCVGVGDSHVMVMRWSMCDESADEDEACVCVCGGHVMVVRWLLGGVARGGECAYAVSYAHRSLPESRVVSRAEAEGRLATVAAVVR